MLKKARLLTHPTLARRDAPYPKQGRSELSLHTGVGGMILTARDVLTRPPTGTSRRAICQDEGLLIPHLPGGSRQIVLHCAHRATTASSWGLCEQRTVCLFPRIILKPRVARALRSSQLPSPFFNILLEIDPELCIRPILIGIGTQVLLDICPGKQMAIHRLKGQLAVHKQVRPGKVYFVADMPRGIVDL